MTREKMTARFEFVLTPERRNALTLAAATTRRVESYLVPRLKWQHVARTP